MADIYRLIVKCGITSMNNNDIYLELRCKGSISHYEHFMILRYLQLKILGT